MVYGPEIIGDFGLEEKTKAVCWLGRTNYGGLWNVHPLIIDPLIINSASTQLLFSTILKLPGRVVMYIENENQAFHFTKLNDLP